MHAGFSGRLVMLGFGSVGQATLPLLLRHFGLEPARITIIIKAGAAAADTAAARGMRVVVCPLTQHNYQAVLAPLLTEGDFLLNLSVSVSSVALIRFCQQRGTLYLDTNNEPWPGRYHDAATPAAARTNYAMREEALALKRAHPGAPTAVLTHGANPGLVNSMVKQALLDMAAQGGRPFVPPVSPEGWAALARELGIRVIHIAERDTQVSARRKEKDEFVNTWSVDSFVDEGLQPAEMGWGSHERHWPPDAGAHEGGCGAAIYLHRPGIATRVRSWTPLQGPYHGFLVTHAESISIADHLSVREHGVLVYRPTVHYAYHPCDDTVLSLHELAGRNWQMPARRRIIRDDITSGHDELGVLLMGHARGVYWYGSRLSIAQARALAPENSATSLQVVAGVLGGMAWAIDHPHAGLVEPDDLDHRTVLQVAAPYLGEVVGVWSDWTPLKDRSPLFEELRDDSDPWQFLNFRVA
jgi:homospermidine synthase